MSATPELVDVGLRAFSMRRNQFNRDKVAAIIEAVEPVIRADERRHMEMGAVIDKEVLREEVEGLPHATECWIHLHERNRHRRCTCWHTAVLALIEGL